MRSTSIFCHSTATAASESPGPRIFCAEAKRESEKPPVSQVMRLRTIRATRYITPLREGGSMPAIVEADDDGLYVLKFRGAGQGPLALVAELIAGEIAR